MGYQKMEEEHVAKLTQAMQLIQEVLGGEQKEAEMPDPKAGLTADIGAALSK